MYINTKSVSLPPSYKLLIDSFNSLSSMVGLTAAVVSTFHPFWDQGKETVFLLS